MSLLMSGFVIGQTKMIAHRSHSGADRGFSLSGLDNFGEHPSMRIERIELDTSIKVKPDTVVTDSTLKLEEAKTPKEIRKEKRAIKNHKKAAKRETTETSAIEHDEHSLELAQSSELTGSEYRYTIKRQSKRDYLGLFGLVLIPGIFVFAGVFKKK